jgi:hypothetical protein
MNKECQCTKEKIKNAIQNIRPLTKEEKEYIKILSHEDKTELLLFYDKVVQKLVSIIFEV